jgi:hypothetical protein
LWDGLDAGEQRKNNQQNKRNGEDVETGHESSKSPARKTPGHRSFCLHTGRAGSGRSLFNYK